MDTDTSRTRRLVRWLKDKIEQRQSDRDDHDPWWVTLMLDLGRPAVAIMILIMCAPGEHYLGMMAGWSRGLAWLTPASLTAYAGISAVVATKRPKDAPGRRTAVWGAILSIGLAMAAQPVAHLYQQELIEGHRLALTITVSVIPAAVFGHLLHMGAAAPKQRRTAKPDRKRDKAPDKRTSLPDMVPGVRLSPVDMSAVTATASVPGAGQTGGQEPDTDKDMMPDTVTWTGHADTDRDNHPDVTGVRRVSGGSMKSVALSKILDNPAVTDADLTDVIKDKFGQDSKPNSIYVAIKRARQEAAA